MDKVLYFLKKNSMKILAITAGCGVIITTISTGIATVKAIKIIEEKELEKGEELTTTEKIKCVWPIYICSGFSLFGTLLCISGMGYLDYKKEVSLMSAYTVLENSFGQYRDNIKKLNGDDADFIARQEIVRAKYDPDELLVPENDEELLFFDYQGMRFFWSSFHNVIRAEHLLLDSLHNRGYASINEYYRYLGLPFLEYGYQLGWYDYESCDPYNVDELEFNYEKIMVGENKDIECWIVMANMPATFDYIL